MIIIAYNGTQEEYDRIVTEKTAEGFILTNVHNITEGNYIGFKQPDEMYTYWRNLFIQTIRDRAEAESRPASEIIEEYTALSAEEKTEILNNIY